MGNTNSSQPSLSTSTGNPLASGCPVAHRPDTERSNHSTASNSQSPSQSSSGGALSSGCPMAKRTSSEPSFTQPDSHATSTTTAFAQPAHFPGLSPEGEIIHGMAIPAAGRGNSDDGSVWLNPSANQLYRALHRKGKGIETEDVESVSRVHEAVTEHTWNCIMEYESLHQDRCATPTLSRFYGMDGIYSLKAKLLHKLTGNQYPFDRHDWIVDRCGQKEVKYIIDYYSAIEMNPVTGSEDVAYFIDARPAPDSLPNLYDRMRVAYRQWKAGEKWY